MFIEFNAQTLFTVINKKQKKKKKSFTKGPKHDNPHQNKTMSNGCRSPSKKKN